MKEYYHSYDESRIVDYNRISWEIGHNRVHSRMIFHLPPTPERSNWYEGIRCWTSTNGYCRNRFYSSQAIKDEAARMQLEEFPDATVLAFGAILKACPGASLTNNQTDFNLDETPMYLHRPPGINAVLSENGILSKLYLDKFEDTTRELEAEITEQMKKDRTFNNVRPHPINQWETW
ncbi:MAG: hypothetical protein GY739_01055, partial [Mesoflavibacter sp.]|nr:hypothetical protein [Mesoflavibacter sp.]